MPITDRQSVPCQSVADWNEKEIHRRGCTCRSRAGECACSSCVSAATSDLSGAEAGRAFFQHARSRLLPRRSFETCSPCGGHSFACRSALRPAPLLRETSTAESAGAACRKNPCAIRVGRRARGDGGAAPRRSNRRHHRGYRQQSLSAFRCTKHGSSHLSPSLAPEAQSFPEADSPGR